MTENSVPKKKKKKNRRIHNVVFPLCDRDVNNGCGQYKYADAAFAETNGSTDEPVAEKPLSKKTTI
jgi:hypothetical protein